MQRLRPAAVRHRFQARLNSSSSGTRNGGRGRVLSKFGDIVIPSREELQKRGIAPVFTPDLSYLKSDPSSLAAKLARVTPKAAPGEMGRLSAKHRREARLAREREEANTRELAAASALEELISSAEATKSQLAAASSPRTKASRMDGSTFDSLVEDVDGTALASPVQSSTSGRMAPGARAAAAAKARREARLRQAAQKPQTEDDDVEVRRSKRRRVRRSPRRADVDEELFAASFEDDSQATLANLDSTGYPPELASQIARLTTDDLAMIPAVAQPNVMGPVPVSETLIEVLNPTVEQPGVIDPKTKKAHPISSGLVSSFIKTDYSSYVPKGKTSSTPLKAGISRYAQQALARNPSIALAQRRHLLNLMERATAGRR